MGMPIGLKLLVLLILAIHLNDLRTPNTVEAGCCGCCCGCCRCCCCPQPPIIIQPPPAIHKVCHVPCCCCKPCCCCCKPCCCCCGCGGGRKKRAALTYRYELLRKRRQISDFVHCKQISADQKQYDDGQSSMVNTVDVLFPLLPLFNDTSAPTAAGNATAQVARARRLAPKSGALIAPEKGPAVINRNCVC